jgi:hypothetical protein
VSDYPPVVLTVERDGRISKVAGGTLEDPVITDALKVPNHLIEAIIDAAEILDMAGSHLAAQNLRDALASVR